MTKYTKVYRTHAEQTNEDLFLHMTTPGTLLDRRELTSDGPGKLSGHYPLLVLRQTQFKDPTRVNGYWIQYLTADGRILTDSVAEPSFWWFNTGHVVVHQAERQEENTEVYLDK